MSLGQLLLIEKLFKVLLKLSLCWLQVILFWIYFLCWDLKKMTSQGQLLLQELVRF